MLHLAAAARPLLLGEALSQVKHKQLRLTKYFVTSGGPLFVPLTMGDRLIGFLAFGDRGYHHPYGSPDLEKIQQILLSFENLFCLAYQQAQVDRLSTLLDTFAAGSEWEEGQGTEEAPSFLAAMVAETMGARAEIWLPEHSGHSLQRVASAGRGPSLFPLETRVPLHTDDWKVYYGKATTAEHFSHADAPPCLRRLLAQEPHFSLAWLPLRQAGFRY